MNEGEFSNFGGSKSDYIADENNNLIRNNKRSLNINNLGDNDMIYNH
jgi:hypothetical protein